MLSDGAHDIAEMLAAVEGARGDRRLTRSSTSGVSLRSSTPAALLDGDAKSRRVWLMEAVFDEELHPVAQDAIHTRRGWLAGRCACSTSTAHIRAELRRRTRRCARRLQSPVLEATTYLNYHYTRMNYAAARAADLPI